MSWRSIPPELGVPTVLAALIDVIGLTVPLDQGGAALSLTTGLTRYLLIAYGLLVLRRRGASRASPLLALGAALQGIAAACALATALISVVLGRGAWVSVFGPLGYVSSGATLGFAVAMIAAARAWRSPLAPIAVLTSLAWHMPRVLAEPVYSRLHGERYFQLFFGLAMLAAQVALLGLFARLEKPEAPADPVGAERGARRAALALALRALLGAASGVVICVLIAGGPAVWVLALGGLLGIAALGVVVSQISGLLAMASARLASLSSPGLYVAGFAALWEVLFNTSVLALQRDRGTTLGAMLVVVVSTVGMVVAGWAVRGVAGLRRDRQLRSAIATRVAWIIALQAVNGLSVGLIYSSPPGHAVALVLLGLAMQTSAIFLLGGLFARVADRIPVNAAADVF